jgi:hypothetical protein
MPNVKNRVLCPICLVGYPEEAISDKTLTDGHIWPNAIRQRSEKARHYRVLLCARCNNSSGSRGDAQMQMFKQVQDEESSGQYTGRRVQIAFGPDVRPVSLNASVITTKAGDSPVSAKIRLEPTRNDPKEMARFRDLSQDRSISLTRLLCFGIQRVIVTLAQSPAAWRINGQIRRWLSVLAEAVHGFAGLALQSGLALVVGKLPQWF